MPSHAHAVILREGSTTLCVEQTVAGNATADQIRLAVAAFADLTVGLSQKEPQSSGCGAAAECALAGTIGMGR